MLKNLFHIPGTFDPDDYRRRQVLHILLIVIVAMALFGVIVAQLIACCGLDPSGATNVSRIFVILTAFILITIILLMVNRSARAPGWLSATIFLALFLILIANTDTPEELYNGRSLLIWVVPIMLASVILRPGSVFLVLAVVCGLIRAFPLPTGVNYFAMLELTFIAFVSWLGMSIANNAIRDARRHAANLEATLNNIADGVLVLNLDGSFLSANPALLRMIPAEELKELIARPLGKTVQWNRKIFSVTASAVPEIGTVAVFRDETRRHETERARDALLATASHELRTPLAAVMNFIQLMQILAGADQIRTDEFNQHLARALENAKRLQRLVNDILDQAQIQAGVLELKHEPFKLRALIEKACQLLDAPLKEKNLAWQLTVAPDVPVEINGDAERLHQALVNLVGNAVKFTNQGVIRVNVSVPLKEKLSIEVIDSGPGIPAEQLPDIFEAFRRGSNYAMRERQGAGLGLSIAKEIVTRMGGEISVKSEPGSGSTFTVFLPMKAA